MEATLPLTNMTVENRLLVQESHFTQGHVPVPLLVSCIGVPKLFHGMITLGWLTQGDKKGASYILPVPFVASGLLSSLRAK